MNEIIIAIITRAGRLFLQLQNMTFGPVDITVTQL